MKEIILLIRTIIPIFLLPLLILIVRTSLTTLIRKIIVSETMTEILIILKEDITIWKIIRE